MQPNSTKAEGGQEYSARTAVCPTTATLTTTEEPRLILVNRHEAIGVLFVLALCALALTTVALITGLEVLL